MSNETQSEIVSEDELALAAQQDSASHGAAGQDALDAANQRADENWEKFVRLQAEMDNLRRRTEKDLQNAHKFALEKFSRELLAVVDSLELGIQAASGSGDAGDVSRLLEGAELTLRQLLSVLEKFGVQTLNPVGDRFNPEQHQAMAMEPSSDMAHGHVIRVFQKGYLLNERLLRPALVVVAQAQQNDAPRIDEQA
ncbi:MAG: GrpE protein [Pseudomonadota bacterium]